MSKPVKTAAVPSLSARTEAMLQQAAPPTGVTVICGFPGSGKTTATRYLAQLLDAVVFDKDTFVPGLEESVMAELTGDPHDRDSDTYHRVLAPHVYSALVHAALIVGARIPVLIDAPFLGYIRAAEASGISLADHIRTTAAAPHSEVRTIWLASAPEQIRLRMQARGAQRDRPKLANWADYQSAVLGGELERIAQSAVDHIVVN